VLGGGVDQDHPRISQAAVRDGGGLAASRHLGGPFTPALALREGAGASPRPAHIALGHALCACVLQEQRADVQHVGGMDPLGSLRQQTVMSHGVTVGVQGKSQDACLRVHERCRHTCNGLRGAPLGAGALRPLVDVGVNERRHETLQSPWHHTVTPRRARQDAPACAVTVRHRLASLSRGSLRAVEQRAASRCEAGCHPRHRQGCTRHSVTPWSAVVCLGPSGGCPAGCPRADVGTQAPESPGRCRLRLDVSPPAPVWPPERRGAPVAPASRVVRGVTHRRGPLLHGHSPASPLRRTPPPPSRLRSLSRGTGSTTSRAPALARWDAAGFSSCSAGPCPHAVAPTPPE